MNVRVLAILLMTGFLLAGCSSDVTKDIVGEWKGVVVQQSLTFYEDGYIDMESPNHSTYEGTYTIEGGNKLTIVFPSLSRPITCTAKISGDDMTLSHPSGRNEEYERQ